MSVEKRLNRINGYLTQRNVLKEWVDMLLKGVFIGLERGWLMLRNLIQLPPLAGIGTKCWAIL